jgi:hypothetical protein
MHEQIKNIKPGWYWIRWIPRIWMLLLGVPLVIFEFMTIIRVPITSLVFWHVDDDFVVFAIATLFCLLVAWFLPLLGGLVILLFCALNFFIGNSEGMLVDVVELMLLWPPGLIFLIFGIASARRERSQQNRNYH